MVQLFNASRQATRINTIHLACCLLPAASLHSSVFITPSIATHPSALLHSLLFLQFLSQLRPIPHQYNRMDLDLSFYVGVVGNIVLATTSPALSHHLMQTITPAYSLFCILFNFHRKYPLHSHLPLSRVS